MPDTAAMLTPAQRSNFLAVTAQAYPLWRARSLTILTGEPFSLVREARLFTALAQPQAGERWLDIGTSTGFYAGVLSRIRCRVDALDISPAMLEVAHRREGGAANWLRLNAENTGLDAKSYDSITMGATLNETADPAAMLREAARLLKPGGRLWLMYVGANGSLGQRILRVVGGLSFPADDWARQVSGLGLVHAAQFGSVRFELLQKAGASSGGPPTLKKL